jgi:RNA polymerase sigma factor (sigma-70 family)
MILTKMGLDYHTAQDVFQETMVQQATGKIVEFQRDKGRLRNWLTTCAKGKALNLLRKSKRVVMIDYHALADEEFDLWLAAHVESLSTPGSSPSDDLHGELVEAFARVRSAHAGSDLEVYSAVVGSSASVREVAKRFKMEPNAVYQAVARTRRHLRKELEHLRPGTSGEKTLSMPKKPEEFFQRLRYSIAVREAACGTRGQLIVWAPRTGRIDSGTIKFRPVHKSLTIGRDARRSEWAFPDPEMSGRHFSIEERSAEFLIRDLDSRNGTYRNHFEENKRVKEAILSDGDVIGAGLQKFVFLSSNSPIPTIH